MTSLKANINLKEEEFLINMIDRPLQFISYKWIENYTIEHFQVHVSG